MLARLAEIEARYAELNHRLADPTVAQNQKLLRELGKEHRNLAKIVEAAQALRKVEQDLSSTKELVSSEKDPEMVAMARQELQTLEARRTALNEEVKLLLLPSDPNDEKNVILEIRSGTGGDEACLFAGDLFRMYSRFAERKGWKVELLSASLGAHGGYKEVIALLDGEGVFSNLKYESGVHRVQRVPATEAQGRIHTSACTVAVLPEAEEVDIAIQEKDLRIDVFRSGGPGGQSVNTTDSAVRVTHLPSGMVVVCQDEKSQHKNKAKALKILRSRLLDHLRAQQEAEQAAQRRSMIKSGDRSEKIRTYNFPQDRLSDHRIGLTTHNLQRLLDGDIESILTTLRTHYQTEALKGSA